MKDYYANPVQPQTAEAALVDSFSNDELLKLTRAFVARGLPSKKAVLVSALIKLLQGDQLHNTWNKLMQLERDKAAQAVWSEDGFFDGEKFDAVHEISKAEEEEEEEEEEPVVKPSAGFYHFTDYKEAPPTLLDVLMPDGVMAAEIQQQLREFVPKPAKFKLPAVSLPESFEDKPLIHREMETSATRDLKAVLRLVEAGKITVSEKNHWATPGTISKIAAVLDGGDFYPKSDSNKKQSKRDEDEDDSNVGPMRPFAWPLLLQAGNLARVVGSKLELTKTGQAALTAPAHETLRLLWQQWVKTDLLDEFRRVDAIRGQTGNGKKDMTNPAGRREVIAKALRDRTVREWVEVDQFSRYMRANDLRFEITRNPWSLYIFDQNYGSLGAEDGGNWNTLQLRYILCLLMEYAATLGLIDIAYTSPLLARDDYGGMWGAEDLEFLSRYDGLRYIRLTALGAYVLGKNDSYTAAVVTQKSIVMNADLEITAITPLPAGDVMLLETFANKTGPKTWKLDRGLILDSAVQGRSSEELVTYLKQASGDEIPDAIDEFFTEINARASSLTDLGPARVIRCAVPNLATFIMNDAAARKLCTPLGDDKLLVMAKNNTAFIKAVRALGFALKLAD